MMRPKETESDRDPTRVQIAAGCSAFGSNREPGESAAVSSGQRLDPNPNDDLGRDGETDQGVAVEEFPGGAWWASGKWRCHMLPYAYKNYKDYRTCMI